jgi:hypothetical protein
VQQKEKEMMGLFAVDVTTDIRMVDEKILRLS